MNHVQVGDIWVFDHNIKTVLILEILDAVIITILVLETGEVTFAGTAYPQLVEWVLISRPKEELDKETEVC